MYRLHGCECTSQISERPDPCKVLYGGFSTLGVGTYSTYHETGEPFKPRCVKMYDVGWVNRSIVFLKGSFHNNLMNSPRSKWHELFSYIFSSKILQ